MIKKSILFSIILFIVIFTPKVFAAEEFATSYDVLYDVDESGITTVTEKISLKNLTAQYYADQFKITIGATQIFDIKASDLGGVLNVTQQQQDNSTSISVNFNQQVAGLGKTLAWTLQFKSKDFAEKSGKVWEVRAPKISSIANLESYNLTLAVPQSFGEPSSISPTPKTQTISSGKMFLTFDINQLKSSGVSANFGTYQLFDFDLSFHLENNNLMPSLTNIALPPDTSFQDVVYQKIDPKPLNVTVDEDGNYLAWFKLNREQKLDVKVVGTAKLYSNSKVRKPLLDETLRQKYTRSDQYWEKDHPQIVAKLNEILQGSTTADTTEKARLIFDFVVNFLKYDANRLKDDDIERLGAVTALNNPDSAVCMEFTDLFIALARAAGIASRELDGYAYSANPNLRPLSLTKDILHAWPEYWNEKRGWVMVDPTWANTTGGVDYFNKLDLNHFVFVVRGSSSNKPVPAGSYKYVALSDKDFLGRPQIDVQVETGSPIISGFPGVVQVKITNIGDAVYPTALLAIAANNLTLLKSSQNTGPIPAFGTSEYKFSVRTKSLLDSYSDQIIVEVAGQKFTKEVKVKPFFLLQPVLLVVGAVVAVMVLVYLTVLGVHFYRFKFGKAQK